MSSMPGTRSSCHRLWLSALSRQASRRCWSRSWAGTSCLGDAALWQDVHLFCSWGDLIHLEKRLQVSRPLTRLLMRNQLTKSTVSSSIGQMNGFTILEKLGMRSQLRQTKSLVQARTSQARRSAWRYTPQLWLIWQWWTCRAWPRSQSQGSLKILKIR